MKLSEKQKTKLLERLRKDAASDRHKVGKFNLLLVLLIMEIPIYYSKFKELPAPNESGKIVSKYGEFQLSPECFEAWKSVKSDQLLPQFLSSKMICKKLQRIGERMRIGFDVGIRSFRI